MLRKLLPFPAALALAGCATVPAAPPAPVEVGIIAINDFHGALEPPRQSTLASKPDGKLVQIPSGGAAYLATAVEQVRAKYANHLTVAAGDLTGGSQLASSIHLDEPAVGVLNRIGLEFNAVGNHEFDRGTAELTRLQRGGCEKHTTREPCAIEPFAGASYKYLAANVRGADGNTLFPGTALKTFGSGTRAVTVGLIGLTLKETNTLVSPSAVAGFSFEDEAQTINAGVEALKGQGADAIVVLIHQGVRTGEPPNPNGCESPAGELAPILDRLDPRVDVVVSGHTHWQYVCEWPSRDPAKRFLLTSAGVYGKLLTDIRLTIDPAGGRVLTREANNVIVQSEAYRGSAGEIAIDADFPRFAANFEIAAYVRRYVEAAEAFSNRVVGKMSGPATKGQDEESAKGGRLGNLIADAQLAATRGAGAQIAFMNPFGIRTSLIPAEDGSVTFGMLYRIQPFDNTLVTMSLTGAELKAVLEQGLDEQGPHQWLAPSAGFEYRYDLSRPVGDRIVEMTLDGRPIDPTATYRVTTNSFLSDGGDSFSLLAKARDKTIGVSDIAALEAWVAGEAVRTIPEEQRVSGS